MMKLSNWELICWNVDEKESNFAISLSEEQSWAVLNVLGIEINPLPNGEFELAHYTDKALEHNRTNGQSTVKYTGKPLKRIEDK